MWEVCPCPSVLSPPASWPHGLSPFWTQREISRCASGRLAQLQPSPDTRARPKKKDFPLQIRFFSYRPSAESHDFQNISPIPSTTYSPQFQTPAPSPAISS